MSQSVREWVSDKGKQWSDSGPIKKKKLGPLDKKLKWYVWQLVNINQGSFIFKIMNFKEIHTFSLFIKKLPLLLNLTQFYTPGNNPNLKNEFIWKTQFSKNKDPCPTRAQIPNRTKKEQQMRNQNNRLCSILAIRTTLRF